MRFGRKWLLICFCTTQDSMSKQKDELLGLEKNKNFSCERWSSPNVSIGSKINRMFDRRRLHSQQKSRKSEMDPVNSVQSAAALCCRDAVADVAIDRRKKTVESFVICRERCRTLWERNTNTLGERDRKSGGSSPP